MLHSGLLAETDRILLRYSVPEASTIRVTSLAVDYMGDSPVLLSAMIDQEDPFSAGDVKLFELQGNSKGDRLSLVKSYSLSNLDRVLDFRVFYEWG